MTPSDKQMEVLKYLHGVESATSEEIYGKVSFGFYANAQKHMSMFLSRMVKAKLITRIKPGVFKFRASVANHEIVAPNQPSLF